MRGTNRANARGSERERDERTRTLSRRISDPDPLQLKIIGPINKFSTIRLNWRLRFGHVLQQYSVFFHAWDQNLFPIHATTFPSTTGEEWQVSNVDGRLLSFLTFFQRGLNRGRSTLSLHTFSGKVALLLPFFSTFQRGHILYRFPFR